MLEVVLSPEAAQSIANIDAYTTEQFGPKQAIRYLENLLDRLDYLAEDPLRGKNREELMPGVFSYFVGSHTVYYQVSNGRLEVIDVLHQSMEPARHLNTSGDQ